MTDDRYLTSAEAQASLRLSRDMVERLIKTGELEAFKAGTGGRTSPYRISEKSVQAYIRRKTVQAATA